MQGAPTAAANPAAQDSDRSKISQSIQNVAGAGETVDAFGARQAVDAFGGGGSEAGRAATLSGLCRHCCPLKAERFERVASPCSSSRLQLTQIVDVVHACCYAPLPADLYDDRAKDIYRISCYSFQSYFERRSADRRSGDGAAGPAHLS